MAKGDAEIQGATAMMAQPSDLALDPIGLVAKEANGLVKSSYREGDVIYRQGDVADSVFYIYRGGVIETIFSSQGKERVVAILRPREFFGVGCVVGHAKRQMGATAMMACLIARI